MGHLRSGTEIVGAARGMVVAMREGRGSGRAGWWGSTEVVRRVFVLFEQGSHATACSRTADDGSWAWTGIRLIRCQLGEVQACTAIHGRLREPAYFLCPILVSIGVRL